MFTGWPTGRLQSARGPPRADADRDRGTLLDADAHAGDVVGAGRPGCGHRCSGAGAAAVLTGPLGAQMLLAATGGSRSAPVDRPLWARTIKRAVRHERLLAIKTVVRYARYFRQIRN